MPTRSKLEDHLRGMESVANQIVLSAPLSVLFESTATFILILTYANSSNRSLRVHDTQWLISSLDSGRQIVYLI
eukprot:CAMPEP_0201979256 /NCGR_PEP_ID=MMETSP0904-20121228/66679_1 /ASSEMBLY_ACC=CAM_ASM_000553 /TAXON_ID=420261 /ORGANISM="Thalassiosira antarctica, Strain CCMP982" /LENGTH=73 /DNA_ID=CAMNT_0048531197 /DNA_START=29 /DNA_END=250 /DNA_ORIENTATION=-